MRGVLIIMDGLGDEPITDLSGKTPLEAASTPNLDVIAGRGRIGCIATTFNDYPIESMVCIMGLLGYPPQQFYPSGRAAFEALAQGIPLNDDDLILRCNIVTVDRQTQRLADFTAGMITDSAARRLLSTIVPPHSDWELFPGQSYRNILVIRHAGINVKALKCREPHMNIGGQIDALLPRGEDFGLGADWSRTARVPERFATADCRMQAGGKLRRQHALVLESFEQDKLADLRAADRMERRRCGRAGFLEGYRLRCGNELGGRSGGAAFPGANPARARLSESTSRAMRVIPSLLFLSEVLQ